MRKLIIIILMKAEAVSDRMLRDNIRMALLHSFTHIFSVFSEFLLAGYFAERLVTLAIKNRSAYYGIYPSRIMINKYGIFEHNPTKLRKYIELYNVFIQEDQLEWDAEYGYLVFGNKKKKKRNITDIDVGYLANINAQLKNKESSFSSPKFILTIVREGFISI